MAHALAIIEIFLVLYKTVDSSSSDESGIAIDKFNNYRYSIIIKL